MRAAAMARRRCSSLSRGAFSACARSASRRGVSEQTCSAPRKPHRISGTVIAARADGPESRPGGGTDHENSAVGLGRMQPTRNPG